MTPLSKVHLIVAGEFHDFDHVRRELLGLLAQDERIRTTCASGFQDIAALTNTDFLLTYTSNVVPIGAELDALEAYLERGGRWLGIHGAAAVTRFKPPAIEFSGIRLPGKTDTPDLAPRYMGLIGARFVSHLPLQRITISPTGLSHPVVDGIPPFTVMDEPYILELRGNCTVYMDSRYTGEAPNYVEGPWLEDDPRPQLLLHKYGKGEVFYLVPGHSCGRYDLQPFIDEVAAEPGPWIDRHYREVVARAIRWGIGDPAYATPAEAMAAL